MTGPTAVLFDLGDTLWHFPKMPPRDAIRGETVRRISSLLNRWGCEYSYWFPNVPPNAEAAGQCGSWPLLAPRAEALKRGDVFFRERDIDLIYVGGAYDSKIDRLAQPRRHFGSRFNIYGRWRLGGYGGFARWAKGKPPLWTRVRAVSNQERTQLYYRTKIGFNMHLSETPMETGNMRMYEVPAHGAMLLCDKAGLNAHEQIFEPGKEAVFYDSLEDAISLIDYYLQHDAERERIARAGFARVHRDYDGETNLKKFLDWASGLPRRGGWQAHRHPGRPACCGRCSFRGVRCTMGPSSFATAALPPLRVNCRLASRPRGPVRTWACAIAPLCVSARKPTPSCSWSARKPDASPWPSEAGWSRCPARTCPADWQPC